MSCNCGGQNKPILQPSQNPPKKIENNNTRKEILKRKIFS